MAGVWILGENHEQTLELLNGGRKLADQLDTKLVALFRSDKELAREYIDYGADEVLVLPPIAPEQPFSSYVPIIVEEARQEDPDVFLAAATTRGKEIAARTAARLNTGLGSECTGLTLDPDCGKLHMKRMMFGGAAVQTVVCTTRPQMATIPLHTFEPAARLEGRTGQVRELAAPPASAVSIIERKPREKESSNITEARVLVCVGRGLQKEADLELARELAEALGGEIACTRPIAEELHWLPEESYIGLSGQHVKPDLYIGIGISGQIQHTVGIRDAKVICAVNRDEKAAIFQISDYGITGDLYEVIPRLTAELKKVLQK